MDAVIVTSLGKLGGAMAMCLSAVGSVLGAGAAGVAAVGAWKKCYANNKAAPFILLTFVGAPLSQTIYGMILMLTMAGKAVGNAEAIPPVPPAPWPLMIGVGVFGGLAMGISAWFQGKAGAAGSIALAETGQGFVNYLSVLGIIETVAIFIMVFLFLVI